jgi:hypothetical protein
MRPRRRPLATLALIAVVLPVSACGSSAPPKTVDSSRTSATKSTATHQTKAVKFAECIRRNGVPNFPDPNAAGKLTIDAVANGSSVDTNTPAFTRAVSACKDLEPAGFEGGKRSSQQQSAALRFAQCIRQNGVKDFPDPANGQPLVNTNRIPSAATSSGLSILNAAMHKCDGLGAAAGVTR